MTEILHPALPDTLWADPRLGRLPGAQPVAEDEWLVVDEMFAAQMAERDRLVRERPGEVMDALPEAGAALDELLTVVLEALRRMAGFAVTPEEVTRPDGVAVPVDRARVLRTLARLCQEDFCLLQKRGEEHVLTAAALLFPSSWTLSEKIGRPLSVIHDPVEPYDPEVARRVQRLFDGVRAGRPLWRVNALPYEAPDLFHPRRMAEKPPRPGAEAPYVRAERQCLLRLPETGAVVFTIHTYMVARDRLSGAQAAALARYRDALGEA